jgi:ABC-type antimicrobial peptide transport system permease subunit
MLLLGTFAATAVLLAVVGLYSVLATAVSQRGHEFGVRMALGARGADVLGLVMGRGMLLTAGGLAIGILGAMAMTRLLTGLLYEVSPGDPLTFVAVAGVLLSVAALACWLPARRATRVDPVLVLRRE